MRPEARHTFSRRSHTWSPTKKKKSGNDDEPTYLGVSNHQRHGGNGLPGVSRAQNGIDADSTIHGIVYRVWDLLVLANVESRSTIRGNTSVGEEDGICFLVDGWTCRYPLAVRGRTVFYPVAPFFADPAARERGERKRRFHAPAKTSSTLHTGVAPAVNVTRHPWLRLLTRRYSHFGARRGPNRPIFRADRSQKLSNDHSAQPRDRIAFHLLRFAIDFLG